MGNQPSLEDINAAIFRRADIAFPELSLESYAGGWRGGVKLDGSASHIKRKDKVVITPKVPNRLLEQGGESVTYWDYVARRERLSDNGQVYQKLCQLAGLEHVGGDNTRFKEAAKSAKVESLLETANSFFLQEIRGDSSEAAAIKKYLTEERKYSEEQIEVMGLGVIPTNQAHITYLEKRGFTNEEIERSLNLNKYIGYTHKLVIPLRSEGRLVSFSFRDIKHTLESEGPKYLNPSGFEKARYLYNLAERLPSGEEIILVEGELDALAAGAQGLENVAAVKGSSISEEQIETIKRLKPKRLVLCFDSDEAGKKATEKTLERLSKEELPLFIARLPGDYDPDQFLREKGKEALEQLIQKAESVQSKRASGLDTSCKSFFDLEARITNRPDALRTGIASLDKGIRIPVGAITLVAGRPRHGKTTFLYNLMLSMADVYPEKKFYFFSYEESEADILLKILNRLTAQDLAYKGYASRYPETITNLQILEGYVKARHTDIEAIESGKKKLDALLKGNRIQILDQPFDVETLTAHLSAANQREQIGAVFIDYIQRIGTSQRRLDIRAEIAHVSDELRKLAVSTGLPLIIGAQFGREGVGKKNDEQTATKPALQALKEAGNLEEDANTVLRVWNPAAEKEEIENEVTLEISVLKARSGNPNVKANLIFKQSLGVIEDAPKGNGYKEGIKW